MKRFLIISLFLFTSLAQDVKTIAKSPLINDGMFVGKSGTIYTTVGGLRGGTAIGKVSQSGEVTTLSNGFKGTIDVYTADEILFYTTNYDDNSLKSYNSNSDKVLNLSSKLDGPASIAVDELGLLYITNFGAPPTYAGNTISVFNPKTSKLKTFLSDKRLFRPQGIVYNGSGRFYIANTAGGKFFTLDKKSKELKEFSFLAAPIGNIQLKNQTLFASSNRGNRIYVLDLAGNFMSFSGYGNGQTKDGNLEDAQFLSPLGLALSRNKKTLYVAQAKDGALRAIDIGNYSFNIETELKKAKIDVQQSKSELRIYSAKLLISNIQAYKLMGEKISDLNFESTSNEVRISLESVESPIILSFQKGRKRFGLKIEK